MQFADVTRLWVARLFPRKPRTTADVKLGTFLGVFTPTILTILGVIMYLRFGWVLGSVGLTKTLLIVILANSITLITTLSFSAIATNIRVGVGGAYFMISRSLGLAFGGAIGLPLFLSQAFSVTLYAFGLAESLQILWGGVPVQAAAFVIVMLVGALAYFGAGLALRTQIPVMVLIALSLAALGGGIALGNRVEPVIQGPLVGPALPGPEPPTFWVAFAVFFPAVTGIMAGLGLSGDLRDPIKSIPRGALSAVLVGFAIYVTIPFFLDRAAAAEVLRDDALVWTRIAPLGALLVMPGLWGAIFSSAVGSVLTAPRTLQALAGDGLAPRLVGKTVGPHREPVVGLIVTLGIALAAVLLGNLNAVAPVVSMFFLTVYGMVNLVAALETLSGDPSWRPRLHIPWFLSLAGCAGCVLAMFLIDPRAAIAAIVVEAGLWSWLARRRSHEAWGDVRRGVYEALVRWSLMRLSDRPMNARNWRPHVLVFADDVEKRLGLIRFGTWFSQGRGVVTVCELIVGDLLRTDVSVRDEEARIQSALRREGLAAFGEVDVVSDVISGMVAVAQANGFGGLDSNTILLGWPRQDTRRTVEFLNVVDRLERLNKSVVLGRVQAGIMPRENEQREIHVWWGGLMRNGDLMLLLAHLLTLNAEWRNAKIRVLSVASSELMKTNIETNLGRLIPALRINAEVQVMMHPKDRLVRDVIHATSRDADVVFLGLQVPEAEADLEAYAQRMEEYSAPLRTVFFVKNASLFVGKLVQTAEEAAEVQTA